MLKSVPPAPTDGPPPRAPLSATSRVALASGLAAGLITPSILRQTIATGLKSPTDLALSDDGMLFYTERARGLYAQRLGQVATALFAPNDLATSSALGMLAVAIDPEFSRNRFVYVFMVTSAEGLESSRVVRLRLDDSGTKVLERQDILAIAAGAASPRKTASEPQFGGALRFGPDGYLYVGLGDARSAMPRQTLLAGTVLRINREGKAAPGSGVSPGYDSRVYAHGMRDPVALAFHPNTETLLVGQRRGSQPDDITMVAPGANGGWDPRCAPPKTGYCDQEGNQLDAASAKRAPAAWRGGKAGEGLTAIERLRGPMWREWRNAFVVAFDRAQRLDLVKLDAQGRVVQATPAIQKLGVGFKAVAQGPDGLYVVTSGKPGGEEIWRLFAQ